MKLSIFPEVLPHPVGKEQKNREAFKTSNPYMPDIVQVYNEEDLIDVVSNYAWSASVFRGYRLKANFVTADFIAIDVDSGMSIDEAYEICEANRLTSLCLPSPSYTDEKPRFRVVFPLETTISNQDTYDATWARLRELFPTLDESCSDSSRFFYACRTDMDVGFWLEADLLIPITPEPKQSKQSKFVGEKNRLYDSVSVLVLDEHLELIEHLYKEERTKIPEAVAYFMENAETGIDGGWWNSLNKFVFVLTLQGCDIDDIIDVVEELAPDPLDDRDHRCIDVAYKDALACIEEDDLV
jgi:hypothetical protein